MSEKRRYLRTDMDLLIRVWGEGTPERILHTRDLSDGGLFLLINGQEVPEVGAVVNVQVQGLPIEAPVKTMEVVRIESAGVGLKHID
ncbi:PilZ domain-containing protein [Aestuariirhabdus litorea]|uniref:PilZ domain-containing protein n=1 Tax=Aestuariirhabdus litorea TaxID=2528527 RepID=A0A3P3VNH1_9GAMM|nr:PilZ domain-containing protein [Aestuariirhabdus litorea]RRJ84302.1 PilZ domain-containing protein [Aestuariirhabdus litorea]RWW97525.1 PilZ domain-containing protein [Endozoicomonadaceae bacterium GTF-13]